MEKIKELAQLFAKYKVYSKSCYDYYSPARTFRRMFPENHYSQDLKTFLSYQDYEPTQRGADLPWWGRGFFAKQKSFRALIVAQDSAARDAGSIVLFTHLMPIINNSAQYKDYTNRLNVKNPFRFSGWNKMKSQFIKWNIDLDFLYMTDASKVYKEGSWKDWDFDRKKSKELLESEIEFCNPDLIILLGTSPLYLLDNTVNYASVVEGGKPISILGRSCVVSPFLIGQGPSQKDFEIKLKTATYLIKETMG